MSYVTLAGAANAPNAVWLVRPGWGTDRVAADEIAALGRNSFTVRLTADPDQPGLLYATWLDASDLGLYRFSEPGNPIKVIRSEDGGRSWSSRFASTGASANVVAAPSPAVGPDGELYVLYLDLGEDRLDYHGEHRGRADHPTLAPGSWSSRDPPTVARAGKNQLSRTSSSRASASSSSLRRIPQSPWIRTAVGSTRASRIRVRGTRTSTSGASRAAGTIGRGRSGERHAGG